MIETQHRAWKQSNIDVDVWSATDASHSHLQAGFTQHHKNLITLSDERCRLLVAEKHRTIHIPVDAAETHSVIDHDLMASARVHADIGNGPVV